MINLFRLAFIFLLLIQSNLMLQGQDTFYQHLHSLPSDTMKLKWLGERINESVLSEPANTIQLAEVYDSIAKYQINEFYAATALNFLGVAQHANVSYDKAADYYLEAIDIIEHTDEKKLFGIILNNLATCYRFRKENSKSIEYYEKAIDIAEEINDSIRIAQLSNNLGMQYVESEEYEEAESLYNNAVLLYEKLNQPIYQGISLLSRANLFIEKESYDRAIEDYQLAMDLVPEKMVPLLHAASIAGIGSAYSRTGQSKKAESYLLSSLEKAEAISHTEQLKESHRELADLYERTGVYKKSLFHQKEYKTAHDEMFSAEQDQALVDALTKYEAEKKQQEITFLESQNELTNLRLANSRKRVLLFGLGLLFFTALSFLLFRFNKRIQSQNLVISKSLSDKEILLKEIHHRVKNNLQFISSLLGLQTEHVKDAAALNALQEGQDRVQSMALIHQNLYQEDNLTGVDMKDYFVKLINSLFDSYNIREEQVSLDLKVSDLNLDVDSVIPIGIIVNELISNSLKYAFPNGRKGIIKVILEESTEGLILAVSDNGVGFDSVTKEGLGKSFGYRLVQAFKEQLNADLSIDGSDGTSVKLLIRRFEIV